MKNPQKDEETKKVEKKQSYFIARMRLISSSAERSEKWTFILLAGIVLGTMLSVAFFVLA
jgi:hypothetical protein